MALTSYDSPTFLGQKDKYLIGLSLPQLMILIGVAFTAFIFTLMIPGGFLVRLMVVIPITGFLGVLLFARIAGLSIPMYLVQAVSYMFRRPVYEEHQLLLLNGAPVWLEAQVQKSGGGFFGKLRRGRSKAANSLEMEQRANELRTEFDSKVVESSVATEQLIREGIRTVLRAGS